MSVKIKNNMEKLPKIKINQKTNYIKITLETDFFKLFQKIEQSFENCFIFESLGEEGKFSRYSVMGFSPDHIIRARENNLIIDDKIYKVKKHIIEGNTFQCEVGFKNEYNISGNTLEIYKNLRVINPSPFMYYLKFGDKKVIGASPELLFSLRDKEMTTKPLAGTIKRGKNEKEDQHLARTLLSDPKEKAEHMMLVDMHRNDIGKVARFGTVKIKDLMNIKKFSHVQHISSEIVGLLKSDEDMFSSLASNFPVGTVSGTPKIETIKIIDSNEPEARGPYGGGVGSFGFNGDCTFALTIRSIFIYGKNGQEKAYTQTSGGIVYDSQTEKEYEEIERKLSAMKKALNL